MDTPTWLRKTTRYIGIATALFGAAHFYEAAARTSDGKLPPIGIEHFRDESFTELLIHGGVSGLIAVILMLLYRKDIRS